MLKKIFKHKWVMIIALMLTIVASFVVRADGPTEVTTFDQLKTAIAAGGSVKLGANISVPSDADHLWLQKNLNLDLNGHTLNLGAKKMYVISNATFTDSSGNNAGTITGTGSYKIYVGYASGGTSYPGSLTIESGTFVTSSNGMLRVSAPGTLKMNGGMVQSAQYPVYVSASGASFTMAGGTVQATSAVGVYNVADAEFIMNGGTVQAPQQAITNLGTVIINGGTVKATNQVGIYVSSGTVEVNGGIVQAPTDAVNIKDGVGGKVIIDKQGIVEATEYRAEDTTKGYVGIYVGNGDTLEIKGGTVKAVGPAVNNKGECVMEGGKITSNNPAGKPTVNVQGEEVTNKAIFIMNDGIVEALGDGSAVNLHSNAAATINGGTITAMYADPEEKQGGAGITAFKDTEVTINGGTISAFSHALAGNGTPAGEPNEGQNAKFTITGGTLNSSVAAGIYAPQVNGETIISGGTITSGGTGVEVRAGTLTITGATITGNQENYSYIANTNGLTTKGAAVSVCQHTTKQPITVNISGGTFYAKVPFSEVNALENPPEDIAKINYDISGGVFHSSGDKTVSVQDYPNGKFIWGGKYTHYVTDYVKDGYGEKIENDPIRPEPNMKAVYKWREVSWHKDVENGTTNVVRHKTTFDDGTTITTEPDGQEPIVDPENPNILKLRTLKNDEIYIEPNPDTDCEVESVSAFDENGNILSVDENNVFLAPDADSTVTVIYTKTEHGETDHGESEGDEDEHGTIYGDSEDENSENNEQGENSFMNTGDLENLSALLDLLLASTIIIIVI